MIIKTITPDDAKILFQNSSFATSMEIAQWNRAQEGRLKPSEKKPTVKSENMLCWEEFNKMAMVYCISESSYKDNEMIAFPLASQLFRTYPAVACVLMGSTDISLETIEYLNKQSEYFHRFDVDDGQSPSILLGIYSQEIQEKLDPMAIAKLV